MLTVKEEKFVQNLLKGMSQREAYKNSYNAGNMKDATIDSKASIIFKKDKIRARYEELINATAKKTIISVQERKELLTKIAKGEEYESYSYDGDIYTTPPKLDTRLKAIEQLNKMDGVYIQKVESNSNVTIENNPFKELSIEELKKLAGE